MKSFGLSGFVIFTIVYLFFFIDTVKSQEFYSGILEVCVKDKSAKPKNTLSTYNKELNNIFKRNKVKKYAQSLPFAKTSQLRDLYTIEYEGNDSIIIEELKKSDLFRFVKRESKPIPLYDPSDYMWYLTTQDTTGWLWHLKKIKADKAWDITKGDTNVKIAIIDTWFDINHPDLENKIFPHFDPYDSTLFYSSCFIDNHGTTVASFAGAETDGGGQLASIGFNVRIIAYNWSNGLNKAVHASTVMGADVISISWFSSCYPDPTGYDSLKIKEILDNGTIICAAAGNGLDGHAACPYAGAPTYSAPFPFSPYYDERIISVTSTDVNDNHAFFVDGSDVTHSHFPEVDICAPGYNVMGATSTLKKDTVKDINNNDSIICVDNNWPYYGSFRGTSFATPIVAGVCGLMKSINPCLTPTEVQDIIRNTADPVQDADLFPGMLGAGRVNAYRAVKEAGTKYIQNIHITGNETFKSLYSIKAGNSVTNAEPNGDVIIENGSNVFFKSRHEIVLEKGFEVKYGATFEADIDPNTQIDCNNNS